MSGGTHIDFTCPGCGNYHILPIVGPKAWGFNGSLERPTLTPSILARGQEFPTSEELKRIMAGEELKLREYICHSFVTDGRIQFLGDSTHKLAGQTVDLFELPDDSAEGQEK